MAATPSTDRSLTEIDADIARLDARDEAFSLEFKVALRPMQEASLVAVKAAQLFRAARAQLEARLAQQLARKAQPVLVELVRGTLDREIEQGRAASKEIDVALIGAEFAVPASRREFDSKWAEAAQRLVAERAVLVEEREAVAAAMNARYQAYHAKRRQMHDALMSIRDYDY
jgi:hypothetical protein